MSIHIVAAWDTRTEADIEAQKAVISSEFHGQLGVLTEEYSREAFISGLLFSECWGSPDHNPSRIPAAVLKERLPRALDLVRRNQDVFGNHDLTRIECLLQSYRDFVDFCERKEKETEKPIEIWIGDTFEIASNE